MAKKQKVATTTEAEMMKWAADGKSWRELAQHLGCSTARIYVAASILGIRSGWKRPAWPAYDLLACVDGLAEGKSLTRVAQEQGINYTTLLARLKSADLPTTPFTALKWKIEQQRSPKGVEA